MRRRALALLLPLSAMAASPWSAAAAGHEVRITSVLEPATLTVAVGDTVTWRNDDDERHRMRSRTGPAEFDSGNLEPGQTFAFAFTVAGTYPYVDERNDEAAGYHGSIVVTASGAAPTNPPGGSTAPGGEPDPATAPTEATIGMAGRAFGPSSVTIAVGGTVTWRNDDDRQHTATSTGDAFDSGVLSPGETFAHTFEAAGTFAFLCAIHTDMTGTITVAEASAGTVDPAATAPATSAPVAEATTGPAPTATAESTASAAPRTEGAGSQAGGGGQTGSAAGIPRDATGDEVVVAAAPTSAAGFVSTVLALVLVGGALVAGTAILLGVVRRADAGVLP